ncbi:reverse transcriptase [Phytophthora megakarya]|uniref:Reverse transcriptase n=1 Tax=Phytophthora megakarya TaxID=4795 RepID=A0A225W4D4_9STRA|nr:reverse transcriptase [Phytophthora megakarya]
MWITPHPLLTKVRALWAGQRRWTQSRRRYKRLIKTRLQKEAEQVKISIADKWKSSHEVLAAALESLPWKRIHEMEGVTAYQSQNILRLKLNRLRLWTGKDRGLGCSATSCAQRSAGGGQHI